MAKKDWTLIVSGTVMIACVVALYRGLSPMIRNLTGYDAGIAAATTAMGTMPLIIGGIAFVGIGALFIFEGFTGTFAKKYGKGRRK